VEFVPAIPQLPSGKVDKKMLRALIGTRTSGRSERVMVPRPRAERSGGADAIAGSRSPAPWLGLSLSLGIFAESDLHDDRTAGRRDPWPKYENSFGGMSSWVCSGSGRSPGHHCTHRSNNDPRGRSATQRYSFRSMRCPRVRPGGGPVIAIIDVGEPGYRSRPVMAVLVRRTYASMRSADATEMGRQKSPQQGE
jgi:hypothetical protein